MDLRQLGPTGTRVSEICLGMMNFRLDNADEGVATLHAALDAGVTFIDTANVYTQGESEIVTGRALAGVRDQVVLATKVHGQMGDSPVDQGNGRRHIKMQCEASLRRLGTDRIDLYQLHRPDPHTPIEESLAALDDLVREGKVHHVGISTYPAWQVMEAIAVAEAGGLRSRPVTEQPPYNIFDRRIEADLLPLAAQHGLGILPWSPLASGLLSGKYADGTVPAGSRLEKGRLREHPHLPRAIEASGRLGALAAKAGLTSIQLALAWLLHQSAVTAPIIGPKDRSQLTDNLAAVGVVLEADVLAEIDAIARPEGAVMRMG